MMNQLFPSLITWNTVFILLIVTFVFPSMVCAFLATIDTALLVTFLIIYIRPEILVAVGKLMFIGVGALQITTECCMSKVVLAATTETLLANEPLISSVDFGFWVFIPIWAFIAKFKNRSVNSINLFFIVINFYWLLTNWFHRLLKLLTGLLPMKMCFVYRFFHFLMSEYWLFQNWCFW